MTEWLEWPASDEGGDILANKSMSTTLVDETISSSSKLARIAVGQDLFLIHEYLLDFHSDDWQRTLVPYNTGGRKPSWKYEGCEPWVLRCLHYWLYEQVLPSDNLFKESGHPEKGTTEVAIPPACSMAIHLYFVAWDFQIPKLMAATLKVLQDYGRSGRIRPSLSLVRRIFNKDRPVGHFIHFFCVDLFLNAGFADTSAVWRSAAELFQGDDAEVHKWYPEFLFLFFRRFGMRSFRPVMRMPQ